MVCRTYPRSGSGGVICVEVVVAGFGTESESMAKGAQAVDEATTLIHGHLGTLQQHVDTMLSQWRGGASQSFGNAHAAFAEQGQKLNNALRTMHEALVQTAHTYQAQEADGSASFDSIATQL
jgi:WXG100 family type VII secretion target